jgi:hypothetical protein
MATLTGGYRDQPHLEQNENYIVMFSLQTANYIPLWGINLGELYYDLS